MTQTGRTSDEAVSLDLQLVSNHDAGQHPGWSLRHHERMEVL